MFDNNLREKLFSFSDPQDTPDWEDLCARMTRKRAAVRRRRIILYSSAAAACMLLLFGLFMLYAPEEANHVPTVAVVPPATLQEAQPSIEEILPQDTPVLLAADRPSLPVGPAPQASAGNSMTPAEQESASPQDLAPLIPADEAPEAVLELPVNPDIFTPTDPKTVKERSTFIAPDKPARNRQYRKWITAAQISYQGAINGNYLFTPSTYTTTWKTPLSLASSDLDNVGLPEFLTQGIAGNEANVISMHFSTPLSAGLNVQKEFNKWLAVGASLTYTLMRGEYQVLTADKSYIVNQNTHYVGIPVSVYLKAVNSKSLNVYGVLGGAVDKAVADEYLCALNQVTTRQSQSVQGVQWSVYGGLGIEYKCTELVGIYIEPAVSHYFENNQPKSIRTIQPTQFKVEVGVRFRI